MYQINRNNYHLKKQPTLILCNPPFNGYSKQLGSEVWLRKIIELFGQNIPLVLFAPVGLRNNLTMKSIRYQKFLTGEYPEIKSLITLPKNIFPNVIFHSEILLFNLPNLEAHYYLSELTKKQLKNKTYYLKNQQLINNKMKTNYWSEKTIFQSEKFVERTRK